MEKEKLKIYLASPFFNEYEKDKVQAVAKQLRLQGQEVYVPMEHEIPNAWDLPNHEWAKKVFEEDIKAIQQSDAVYVLNFGMYSDSGTAWECGYAYGINKPVINILCGKGTYSLMMINGSHEFFDIINVTEFLDPMYITARMFLPFEQK